MSASRLRRSGGGRQFAVGGGVGRWRHVAVVDGVGCGCRPRRPSASRLLMSLPSFLRPSPKPSSAAPATPAPRRNASISSGRSTQSSSSSSFFFPASGAASTASSSSAYSHDTTTAKPPPPAPAARKRKGSTNRAKKRREETRTMAGEEEGDVGVAVEKESSDPRGDFRDSMVQMAVEMGLCDWDGLRCMLRRLLALNAPRHHAAILAAFAEVCAHLASSAAAPPPPPPPPPPAAYQYHHYDDYYSY